MKMLLQNNLKKEAKVVAQEILAMQPKLISNEDQIMRQAAKIVLKK